MFTVTQAVKKNTNKKENFVFMNSPLWMRRSLRTPSLLHAFEPPQELAEVNLLGVAHDVHRGRKQSPDHKVFLLVSAFDATQNEFIVFQRRFKAKLAIAKKVEEFGDPAVDKARFIAGAEDRDLIQRLHADPLADSRLIDRTNIGPELGGLSLRHDKTVDASSQNPGDATEFKRFGGLFQIEILDHPDAAEERDGNRFGKPQRVIPKNERDADLGNRGRRRRDLVDRELADARRLAGIFLRRLRKTEP